MSHSSPKSNEPSVCASCGETFGCGVKLDGCWCIDVTLSEETTAEIAKDFEGCLCPKCFNSFACSNKPNGEIEV